MARKAVSERQVNLGVLLAARDRLIQEAQRKEELEKKAALVGRRLEVVEVTRSLVNSFMDQVLIRVKNDIARSAGEILEEVSGKYSLLKIDDDFNIQVEDGGEWYPISRYSGGEIDMIAVSVRVAISEYLMRFGPDGESYSFLILDEVFGSQDQEHREKMIQMLRSLEERFPQIIAISHISDVQGQFDNTLLVVEDELGNSRVEAFRIMYVCLEKMKKVYFFREVPPGICHARRLDCTRGDSVLRRFARNLQRRRRQGHGLTWRLGGVAWLWRSAPRRRGHSHAPQPALPALGGDARLQRHCRREQFPAGARRERVRGRSRPGIV